MSEEKSNLEEIVDELYELIFDDYNGRFIKDVEDLIKNLVSRSQIDMKFVDSILKSE